MCLLLFKNIKMRNKRTCFALFILHANWGKWCKRWCQKTFCLSNRSILYWREQAASHDFSHDPTNPVPFGAGNESYVSFFKHVTACRAFACGNMIGLLMYILFNFGVPLRMCQVHEILFLVSDTHTHRVEKSAWVTWVIQYLNEPLTTTMMQARRPCGQQDLTTHYLGDESEHWCVNHSLGPSVLKEVVLTAWCVFILGA